MINQRTAAHRLACGRWPERTNFAPRRGGAACAGAGAKKLNSGGTLGKSVLWSLGGLVVPTLHYMYTYNVMIMIMAQ